MAKARVMGGCRCNPATATPIATACGATLFRTKSGRFFLEKCGQLTLLSKESAATWINLYTPEALEKAFDTEKVHMTLDLPARIVKEIDKTRGTRPRSFIIIQALERYLESK